MKILLFIVAVVVGVLALGCFVAAVEFVGHQISPPSPELQEAGVALFDAQKSGDQAAIEKTRARMSELLTAAPIGNFLWVIAAWMVGTAAGASLAAFIAPFGRLVAAILVTLFGAAATAATLVMIPHPSWVAIAGLTGIMVSGIASGSCVACRRNRKPQAA